MSSNESTESEVVKFQNWLTAFEEAGGSVIQEIEKKKQIFGLLREWHSAFDEWRRYRGQAIHITKDTSVFLVSLFGDSKLPTHHDSSVTFAMELSPPDEWVPNVKGIPGEFVLFDSQFRWTIIVTHEETETLFS